MKIQLTKGLTCLVDDDCAETITSLRWYASWSGRTWYAQRNGICVKGVKGPKIYLHRRVLSVPSNVWVDHINGDTLDNRRTNLRIVSAQGNAANSIKRNHNGRAAPTSRFKGVTWNTQNSNWNARITVNYRPVHLGVFANEMDAARAYDDAARYYFGDFARSNFA